MFKEFQGNVLQSSRLITIVALYYNETLTRIPRRFSKLVLYWVWAISVF